MTLSDDTFGLQANRPRHVHEPPRGDGPRLEETDWGYIICAQANRSGLRNLGGIAGRFVGAILLMAAAGLWVMPDSLHGGDLIGMKLAAMVMFSVFGGYFLWAGRDAARPEFRIDLKHREVRIGRRGHGDGFRQSGRVDFDSISSVFLLRSKDQSPTRLFLRLADLGTGIEIATGNRQQMEDLKQRLTDDFTGQARRKPADSPAPGRTDQPVRPVRPRRVAA